MTCVVSSLLTVARKTEPCATVTCVVSSSLTMTRKTELCAILRCRQHLPSVTRSAVCGAVRLVMLSGVSMTRVGHCHSGRDRMEKVGARKAKVAPWIIGNLAFQQFKIVKTSCVDFL